ncbi:hypothetical protein EDD86DRAFT_260421 [Gorgonomyces haynaldii]|nr:hypothetical protein EDD86DRAFT_260421 [Gorgonomyces haynaldii]
MQTTCNLCQQQKSKFICLNCINRHKRSQFFAKQLQQDIQRLKEQVKPPIQLLKYESIEWLELYKQEKEQQLLETKNKLQQLKLRTIPKVETTELKSSVVKMPQLHSVRKKLVGELIHIYRFRKVSRGDKQEYRIVNSSISQDRILNLQQKDKMNAGIYYLSQMIVQLQTILDVSIPFQLIIHSKAWIQHGSDFIPLEYQDKQDDFCLCFAKLCYNVYCLCLSQAIPKDLETIPNILDNLAQLCQSKHLGHTNTFVPLVDFEDVLDHLMDRWSQHKPWEIVQVEDDQWQLVE